MPYYTYYMLHFRERFFLFLVPPAPSWRRLLLGTRRGRGEMKFCKINWNNSDVMHLYGIKLHGLGSCVAAMRAFFLIPWLRVSYTVVEHTPAVRRSTLHGAQCWPDMWNNTYNRKIKEYTVLAGWTCWLLLVKQAIMLIQKPYWPSWSLVSLVPCQSLLRA